MALNYHPAEGEILKCDFGGFTEPEMTKGRYVVCVSPKFVSRGRLVTVVPLSTTAPDPVENYHCELDTVLPQNEGQEVVVWVKCDMLMAASFTRLSPWWIEKKQGMKRIYKPILVSGADMKKIKDGILYSLGLGALIEPKPEAKPVETAPKKPLTEGLG